MADPLYRLVRDGTGFAVHDAEGMLQGYVLQVCDVWTGTFYGWSANLDDTGCSLGNVRISPRRAACDLPTVSTTDPTRIAMPQVREGDP